MLFSDIEGSTALLHRLGDRWGEALAGHRRIIRSAVGAAGGTEMGTEGDSFFVVFGSAHDGLRASLDAQRGLQEHAWPGDAHVRVRMGLHTGEPQWQGEGFVGEDVHRAARIGATAHGGQVVLSDATRRLVGEPPGVTIRDLGRHRLKDLPGEEQLYDAVAPGLAQDFPPLRSLGKRAALPLARTPLVGRDADVTTLVGLYASGEARLVTVLGPGGCGKTRLALAAAESLEDDFADGVYFVALEGVDDAVAMASTVADALDAPPGPTVPARLRAQLADRHTLVVLDNLEQIDGAEQVVDDLLEAGQGVRVLATSRRPLLLAGEHELPVPPLGMPPSDRPADVAASMAVDLYVRSARLVRPAFTLTDDNRADVVELVHRLDGLPLAIELAGASARLLGPAALLSRLDTTLGRAVTATDRPARHRSLGAAIGWSHDLLSDDDRVVFRRLGVFRAPADLDAVEAVVVQGRSGGTAPPAGGTDTLAVVGRLVGSSLVQVTDGRDGEPRVGMLETVRTFALERLAEAGDEDDARRRHLAWCFAAVTRLSRLLRGPLHPVALDGLAALDPDVRGALEWSLRKDGAADPDRVRAGVELLAAATRHWYRFGDTVEARRWHERAAALAEAAGVVDTEATVDLAHSRAVLTLQQGDTARGLPLAESALASARRLGRVDLEARALNIVAIAHHQRRDLAQARTHFEDARDLAATAGDVRVEAMASGNLVPVLLDEGRADEAVTAGWEAVETQRRLGDRWNLAMDQLSLVTALLFAGRPAEAHARLLEWATAVVALRDRQLDVNLVEIGAGVAAASGDPTAAARLAGCADALRESIPMRRSAQDDHLLDRFIAPCAHLVTTAAWRQARADGRRLSVDDALRLVLAGARPGSAGEHAAP